MVVSILTVVAAVAVVNAVVVFVLAVVSVLDVVFTFVYFAAVAVVDAVVVFVLLVVSVLGVVFTFVSFVVDAPSAKLFGSKPEYTDMSCNDKSSMLERDQINNDLYEIHTYSALDA